MFSALGLLLLLFLFGSSIVGSYPAQTRNIYQFSKPTWVENLAVQRNGKVLVTLLTSPDLYQIDPFTPGKVPSLVHSFPTALGLFGIAEFEPDVFVVVSGNFSIATFVNTPGTYSVWKVDLRKPAAVVKKITDVPEGVFLNGATVLNPGKATILLADSGAGVVFRLNANTGRYKVVLDDALLKPLAGAPVEIGVNGLHVGNQMLYFTNTNQNLFAKVQIREDGTAVGPFEVIARNAVGSFDDFGRDRRGNAYVCQGSGNQLAMITPHGLETEVAGNLNSTALAGCTSAKFGRTIRDRKTLYVTTNGGLTGPVNGTTVEGGKLVAVDF
ncbi:MAG: hypothetical protein Q9190_002092 [Brigantiaea leucoxantha]